MACDPRVVANLLDQIAELKAQLAQAQPKDSAGPAAESTDAKDNSGLDDFEVGKRNFDTGGGASIRILADFKYSCPSHLPCLSRLSITAPTRALHCHPRTLIPWTFKCASIKKSDLI